MALLFFVCRPRKWVRGGWIESGKGLWRQSRKECLGRSDRLREVEDDVLAPRTVSQGNEGGERDRRASDMLKDKEKSGGIVTEQV